MIGLDGATHSPVPRIGSGHPLSGTKEMWMVPFVRLIGRLEEPLLEPKANEREGYVPNVVCSCGGLIHNGELIIPYAMSDYASTFATIPIDTILEAMVRA